MAITDKLQKLYLKMGGDPNTGASNVEEWIDKIEDVAGNSGSSGASGVLVLSIADGPKDDKILNRSAKEIVDAFNNNTPIFVRLDEENPENLGENSTAYNLLHVGAIEKTTLDSHDILFDGFTDEVRITLRTYTNEYELSTSTNGTSYYPEHFTNNPRLYAEQPSDGH